MSATFVSTHTGMVLGTRSCASSGGCLALLRTDDAGRTWTALNAPPVAPSRGYEAGVRTVRFADPQDGWVFDPDLWATHDGGATWTQTTLPSSATHGFVSSLEAAAGAVHAMYISGDAGVELLDSPTTSDRWTASPTTIPIGAGPVPQGQVVLHGNVGWAIEVDRTVVGGARLLNGQWQTWQPPCASAGGSVALAAATATDLVAVCNEGVWTGGPESVHVYLSGDGGANFRRVATALPMSEASTITLSTSGAVVVGGTSPASGELLLSTNAGTSWRTVVPSDISTGELGFTTATQGIAVTAQQTGAAQRMLMTFDGGYTWNPVSFA
jgi:hypothetical protein